ncbi:fimbrial protein, partial [Clostridioides difficile]|nr:fimbrial protein [Clostridioides difficile]
MQIIFDKKYRPHWMSLAAIAMSLASSIASANLLVYPMAASIGAGKESAAELR